MFNFFRRQSDPPETCPGNPGLGVEAKVTFTGDNGEWEERVDLVKLLATVMRRYGHPVRNEGTWLSHRESGYAILPQLGAFDTREDGRLQTMSTIQINHREYAPHGVFEYQHSMGECLKDSLVQGFDQWVQTDFVALLDAQRPQPRDCMMMEMKFPEETGRARRRRRIILGPVAHFRQDPVPQADSCGEEEHPFCPCCLLTQSLEAFRPHLESEGFCCLRLFAAREPDGTPQADCRVNGEDWEPGAEALRAYALTWDPAGYEFRKQYVVLRTLPD
ncbi:MAG: hypothetical protein KDA80_07860 [Planctomycetaceae bacterium]|nr:hypothetical protein [Planctomycetaceae bacterium]